MLAAHIFVFMRVGVLFHQWIKPIFHAVIIDRFVDPFLGKYRAVHFEGGQPIQRLGNCLVRELPSLLPYLNMFTDGEIILSHPCMLSYHILCSSQTSGRFF